MVYPVNNIKFKIGTEGLSSSETEMAIVRDMETFEIAFDNGVEEWNPMDQNGWVRRLVTAKSLTISLAGKRHYGDPGNDYIAGLAFANGNDAVTVAEVEFPNGDILAMTAVVNVTTCAGGDSTAIGALEFELMSDGAPEYIVATEG